MKIAPLLGLLSLPRAARGRILALAFVVFAFSLVRLFSELLPRRRLRSPEGELLVRGRGGARVGGGGLLDHADQVLLHVCGFESARLGGEAVHQRLLGGCFEAGGGNVEETEKVFRKFPRLHLRPVPVEVCETGVNVAACLLRVFQQQTEVMKNARLLERERIFFDKSEDLGDAVPLLNGQHLQLLLQHLPVAPQAGDKRKRGHLLIEEF
mmetsp:Transcript_2652/g.6173  ORF Transcript_2652/g.6173 Transcript_2652/m.6173 type:complete len:210 (-) Transcript_2652:1091-1720(-)